MRFRSSALLGAILLSASSVSFVSVAPAQAGRGHSPTHGATLPTLTVHKSPGCLCCDKWVNMAKAEGFKVKVLASGDMREVKQKAGVPLAKASCHTTIAAGYFFEGHVPPDLVRAVLETQPAIAGLLAPGMPQSAPGMDAGGPHQAYEILAMGRDGRLTTYARR